MSSVGFRIAFYFSPAKKPWTKMVIQLVFGLSLPLFCLPTWSCNARVINLGGDVIALSGCISDSSANALRNVITSKTRKLLIESEGGSVPAALGIARIIQENRIQVHVRGYCLSSCANYLLPAASFASVEKGSRIMFHGDAQLVMPEQRELRQSIEEGPFSQSFNKIVDTEAIFQSKSPRASFINFLQRNIISEATYHNEPAPQAVAVDCKGQELRQWTPSPRVLIDLSLIDQIVEVHRFMIDEVPPGRAPDPPISPEQDYWPFAHCARVSRPP